MLKQKYISLCVCAWVSTPIECAIWTLQHRARADWTSQWKCTSHWKFRLLYFEIMPSRDTPTDVRLKLRFRFELDTINFVTEICACICVEVEIHFLGAHTTRPTRVCTFLAAKIYFISSILIIILRATCLHYTEALTARKFVIFRKAFGLWFSNASTFEFSCVIFFSIWRTIHFNISRISDLCTQIWVCLVC